MSATPIKLWQKMAALARLSLAQFWCQALPKDNGLLQLLNDEARQLLNIEDNVSAPQLKEQLEKSWPPDGHGPLELLIRDHNLPMEEVLLLTLLGEVERSHLITLVVHQLQAPSPQPHPTVHLVESWLQSIFPEQPLSLLGWLYHPLVEKGLVAWLGEGPLPLRQLRTSAPFWALMTDQLDCWPGCSELKEESVELLPELIRQQIPVLAEMLDQGHAKGLIIRGFPGSGRHILTSAIAAQMGLKPLTVPDSLWQETPALVASARYAGWLPILSPKLGPGEVIHREMSEPSHPIVFHVGSDGAIDQPGLTELVMPLPDFRQRLSLWQSALEKNSHPIKPGVAERAAAALVSGPIIGQLAGKARLIAERNQAPLGSDHIVEARVQLGSERLRLLAQPDTRLVPRDAIVLPPLVESELERLLARAEQRELLWQGLGATLKQTQTAGVRALFVGESGTGKTLAANFIATRLGAPLYRVDLSAVMNKYVGESEKNLSAVLDMAAANDVVLLFDESDSLFGKRTEGKETGERFANMLTHFLLTRIENHPGIVLLTSNNRERIDPAFTRRLDLIIEFPIPGFEERQQLWQSHLGSRGPGDEVYRLLAGYCDFTGGQLRNVVLAAATHAGSGPIAANDLLVGLNAEYRKLGRELPGKLNQLMHLNSTISETPLTSPQDT
ncbi:hypothetical protein BTA51_26580 [Hahella sp. CCB-MM4]|uniref:ATP-binding protein n=1 Tax=Hahella sp. (strain CCB-MM4) TaxID=1926491 RepID=UPI000BC4B5AB|nr:ATP-binding protein [Hahella sp. CCB-MM4]OZG70290.1 hypothetical protein BTA51_26580 [Hahella sp. CCB-MM4]